MTGNALGNRGGYNSFYENNYVHDIRTPHVDASRDSSRAAWLFGDGIVFRNNIIANSRRAFAAYQLGAGNPAIDRGRSFQNVPSSDFFGAARPVGVVADIGAADLFM